MSGVLIKNGIGQGIIEVAKKFGIEPDHESLNLRQLLQKGDAAKAFKRGDLDAKGYWAIVLERINRWLKDPDAEIPDGYANYFSKLTPANQEKEIINTIIEQYGEIDGMGDLVENLAEQRFALASITNADRQRIAILLEKYPLLKLVYLITTYQIKATKPDKIAFLRSALKLRQKFGPKKLVIFVDDARDNLTAIPKHLGWHTFHFEAGPT